MATASGTLARHEAELRRSVTIWGSYSWGYADVGADIYVALGLVMASAEGLSNVAFLIAGLIYVCVGLAYTELAAMHPLAGGGPLFVLRGLGDFWGFVAGWAVLLDFTIDIALFAFSSAGYIDHFFPQLSQQPWITVEAVGLVVFLYILNVIGVRESSKLNEVAAAIDICAETVLIFIGFAFAFVPTFYWHQTVAFLTHFDPSRLALGFSFAIISFVGLESISQASQETERPTTIVPRTSVALILTILAYALALSNLTLGVLPWQTYDPSVQSSSAVEFCKTVSGHVLNQADCIAQHTANQNAPIAWLAIHLPIVGSFIAPVIAILGAMLLLISSNAGVYGSSRIMYSMAEYGLTYRIFTYIQPKFRTPVIALSLFTFLALLELALSALTPNALETLAYLYAFGAATSYTLVFVSLLRLRFTDLETPRVFRVPWNVPVERNGTVYQVPIVGVLGLIGISTVLISTILTHPIGRIAGPLWLALGLVLYYFYRRSQGRPFLRSISRDWSQQQLAVYVESGEVELADEYRQALERRRRKEDRPEQ